MKINLKYEFEIIEVDGTWSAVPVGDNAGELHGIVNLNKSGAQILQALIDSKGSLEEAHKRICQLYPEDNPNELGQQMADFLNLMVRNGLLLPQNTQE